MILIIKHYGLGLENCISIQWYYYQTQQVGIIISCESPRIYATVHETLQRRSSTYGNRLQRIHVHILLTFNQGIRVCPIYDLDNV